MSNPQQPKRRWYDIHSDTAKFIETISVFPNDVQSIVCNALTHMADVEFHASELIHRYKSIGKERVLALYQSKKKRRKYDQNPFVHTTMNYGAILSDEQRTILMAKATEVIYVTLEYFGLCTTFETQPELSEITRLAEETIQNGGKSARAYLAEVKTVFQKTKTQKTDVTDVKVEKDVPKKPDTLPKSDLQQRVDDDRIRLD